MLQVLSSDRETLLTTFDSRRPNGQLESLAPTLKYHCFVYLSRAVKVQNFLEFPPKHPEAVQDMTFHASKPG